jgi:hypothetical protein
MNVSKSRGRRAAVWAALCSAAVMTSASWADQLGFRAYNQQWDPAKPTVTSVSPGQSAYGYLSTIVVDNWNQFTELATPVLTADLEKPDQVAPGFTLYNVVLTPGAVQNVEMRVAPVQDPVAPAAFQSSSPDSPILVIHGVPTTVSARSTSPLTSRDTDPAFNVTLTLTAYIRLSIGPKVAGVSLSKAEVAISNVNVQPASGNLAAEAIQAFGSIQNFFGARSFLQQWTDKLDGQSDNITQALSGAIQAENQTLRGYAPAGNVIAGIFADSEWLNVVFAPHMQPDSGGQMTGSLTVSGLSNVPNTERSAPAAYQDCSRTFSLSDTVQVQPDYVESLVPLKILADSGPTVSLDSQILISGATIQPTADGFSCRYSLGGLADRFSNRVQFNEPGVKSSGSSPAVGYVIDVTFQGCSTTSNGPIHASNVACLATQGICGSPLIPESGVPLNCNLVGAIQLSASGGPGVAKQSGLANQGLGNGQTNVWGGQAINRTASPATSAPQWGAPASTSGSIAPGSSINRGVGSSLQNRAVQAPATPAAPAVAPSSLSPQF